MSIADLHAFPLTFRIPAEHQVALGIGRTVKRDAVLVRVTTSDGIVGWGEAHAARAPTAIAELINSTMAMLIVGMDESDIDSVWQRVYRMQLASHGTGAAAAISLSGIDMALWDIAGKRLGKPLYELLGGTRRPVPAYAGGIALGYQPTEQLIDEASSVIAQGYRALKLRLGDTLEKDRARVVALRQELGDGIDLLTDANTAYSLADVAAMMPTLDEVAVGWLEEPFPAHCYRDYMAAAMLGNTPLAAGENHYTRFDFERVADDGAIRVWQPDLSKSGGITEVLRIAALAQTQVSTPQIHPHTSVTSLNMAASAHVLCALDNAGYFEADLSVFNPFRTRLCSGGFDLSNGTVIPSEAPGLGVSVDESLFDEFPVIAGPGYI